MLAFELRTTPPPVVTTYLPATHGRGINVNWPMAMPWMEYLSKLQPIGTLCKPTHEHGWLEALHSGSRNVGVAVVVGYASEPKGGIIVAGCRKVQPYILVNVYIPSKQAVYDPPVWIRECDGEYVQPLTPQETEEVLKNAKFLSIFEKWRQQTNFEGLERDSLGASQRQVPGEDRTDGAD